MLPPYPPDAALVPFPTGLASTVRYLLSEDSPRGGLFRVFYARFSEPGYASTEIEDVPEGMAESDHLLVEETLRALGYRVAPIPPGFRYRGSPRALAVGIPFCPLTGIVSGDR